MEKQNRRPADEPFSQKNDRNRPQNAPENQKPGNAPKPQEKQQKHGIF